MLALAANTGDYGKCFILTADINMAGQVFTAPIIAADGSPAFSGTFDGNGHKITNFTISEDYYDLGLFGTIIGGSVKNLGIENCSVSGFYYVGGLVGLNSSGSIVSSFWNTQTSGQATSAGGTGKTTTQMKTISTFTSAGWDFVEIWGIEETQTYPYLTALAGDLNHDKKVDFKDFAILASHWLEGI